MINTAPPTARVKVEVAPPAARFAVHLRARATTAWDGPDVHLRSEAAAFIPERFSASSTSRPLLFDRSAATYRIYRRSATAQGEPHRSDYRN